MGRLQGALRRLLESSGLRAPEARLPRPSQASLLVASPALRDEIDTMYRRLGGLLRSCRVNPGPWDIEVEGIAVELDEEQHFNRYRAETLDSLWYRQTAEFARAYRSHCERHEGECLRKASNRGYWQNARCNQQFGPAAMAAMLDDVGSSRWKQRAFYDFLKDLAPALVGTRVARIAIWDEVVVDGVSLLVKDILEEQTTAKARCILTLIETRGGVRSHM